ncbi:MAG: branched-chain amino acid transport system permease protein, partial [Reinekea sp.]
MIRTFKKELILFTGLLGFIILIMNVMGAAYGTRMLVEASCYAIIAL